MDTVALAVRIAGPDANGGTGGVYKTEIRLFPADGRILSRSHIVWFKGVRTAEGNFHSRIKRCPVQGTGNLADTASDFLYHSAAAVCSCFLIAFFSRALAHCLIKGKFLAGLYNGAV